MTLDIDAIEARAKNNPDKHEALTECFGRFEDEAYAAVTNAMIGLQDKTADFYRDDLSALCAEVRELRAALEQAKKEIAFLESALNTVEDHLRDEEKDSFELEKRLSETNAALCLFTCRCGDDATEHHDGCAYAEIIKQIGSGATLNRARPKSGRNDSSAPVQQGRLDDSTKGQTK